ncbi:nucleotidyl transferase AbiEii/AbiGii toxin family protein [Paenalcaligenes hominis]|uniref:nucleotidyl transferase AbiEii/AbiGii toxin family protein n=1 Tax=Paenalcaligenes hominis TaxID=643674 RepID=UPI003525EFD0
MSTNKDRAAALHHIQEALDEISHELTAIFPKLKITKSYQSKVDALRLIVTQEGVSVKVELSPVLRGTVFTPTLRETTETVEQEFGYAEVNVVAIEDLYAGKLCAAFDRQHPRDFFDVMLLLEKKELQTVLDRRS